VWEVLLLTGLAFALPCLFLDMQSHLSIMPFPFAIESLLIALVIGVSIYMVYAGSGSARASLPATGSDAVPVAIDDFQGNRITLSTAMTPGP
jgi:hypothetical protein